MKKSILRTRALLMCLVITCLVLFLTSALASGIEISHECTGDNCLVCTAISLREKALISLVLLTAVFGIVLKLEKDPSPKHEEQRAIHSVTPVCLKVKLSN